MIDINLLGKKQAAVKPEKPPKADSRNLPRLLLLLLLAVVVIVAFYTYSDILVSLVHKTPIPKPRAFQPRDTTKKVVPPVTQLPDTHKTVVQLPPTQAVEQKPAEQPKPPQSVTFDYRKSIEHISAFTAFAGALNTTTDITVLSVSDGHITAEITVTGDIKAVKDTLTKSLPNYLLDFTIKNDTLQIFGALKAEAQLPSASPSVEYTSAEKNLNALDVIAKKHSLKIPVRGKTVSIPRGTATVLPVIMKLSGTEKNLVAFLQEIRSTGLSLNIIEIRGKSTNRSQTAGSAVLYFNFEINQ